jgi:hypothetical protein
MSRMWLHRLHALLRVGAAAVVLVRSSPRWTGPSPCSAGAAVEAPVVGLGCKGRPQSTPSAGGCTVLPSIFPAQHHERHRQHRERLVAVARRVLRLLGTAHEMLAPTMQHTASSSGGTPAGDKNSEGRTKVTGTERASGGGYLQLAALVLADLIRG